MSAHKVFLLVVVGILLNVAFVRVPSLAASAPSSADEGAIAYVRRSTHDIHVISPDGTGDRVLWTAPHPVALYPPFDLAWRADGRQLAFSSQHEETCSWYQSDVYAIGYNGTGYRRVTNSPACAELAGLPKGSVTVEVTNYTGDWIQAYVAGAPGIKSVFDGTLTFEDVADFGPGVTQPSVGIWGLYRFMPYPPLADVQPGETVFGGYLIIDGYSDIDAFGAGKVSWKANGSALAYGMRSATNILQIPANPPYGSIGELLPKAENTSPDLVDWGPTAATKDQYLYSTGDDAFFDGVGGIYLNTVGDPSGGDMLVFIDAFYGAEFVFDVEWLPDASGFLFTKRYVPLEIYTDIFEYSFATTEITQLTELLDDSARGLSISPDGQQVVFERVVDIYDTTSSLWIMNIDGSGLHKLADDAGRPAWGQAPLPLTPRAYIPMVVK